MHFMAPRSLRVSGCRGRQDGLSLVELMVALAIAAVLLLGLSQIFAGSKNVYRLQEGMSRVQENARFVVQYLERNIRMAGYLGCGNDIDLTNKAGSPPAFLNHLEQYTSAAGVFPIDQDTLKMPERFQRPIEGFAYSGGSIDNAEPTAGALADWTPALPADLELPAGDMPAKGSDILVLRIVDGESTPLIGDFDMALGKFSVGDASLVKAGRVYAITNCANARIFKVSDVAGNVVHAGPAPDNNLFLTPNHDSTWTGTYANAQFNQSGATLNAELHPTEYLAIYVGLRDGDPVLKAATGAEGSVESQELADGVEMMRIWYGVDTDGNGTVDKYVGADNADADANLAETGIKQRDINWRRVLSVRIALLMRSPDRVNVNAHTGDAAGDNVFHLFDASVKRPDDRRYREVYTTTIALRNRLGNY